MTDPYELAVAEQAAVELAKKISDVCAGEQGYICMAALAIVVAYGIDRIGAKDKSKEELLAFFIIEVTEMLVSRPK
jgi:hypothetical protein